VILIIWYVLFVAVGNVVAYLLGLVVERTWGSYPSMVAFIAMYFVVLWVAWILSVRITARRPPRPYGRGRVSAISRRGAQIPKSVGSCPVLGTISQHS
jgi:hypothetical protein